MQRPGRDPADAPVPAGWTPDPDAPAGAHASPPADSGPPAPGYGRPGPIPPAYRPAGGFSGAPGPAGYGPGPYGVAGGWPPVVARVWPPTRRERRTALATVVALAALGALLAVAWVQLAPRLAFRVDQPGRALPVVPEAEEYVAADGRFVLLTLAAGVLAGLVCWLLRSSRGPLVIAALAVGGLLGAVVTWRLGMRLAPGYRPEDLQEVGRIVHQPLELIARAALVVEPVAAVLVYLLAVGFSSRTDLGRPDPPAPAAPAGPGYGGPAHPGPAPSDPVSSDSG